MNNNQNYYWTEETDKAITKFVKDDSLSNKDLHRIYKDELYDPFETMIESLINKYNFYFLPIDQLKAITHGEVYCVLTKSRRNKGKYYDTDKKGFSYFTAVIINFLLVQQNKFEQQKKKETQLNYQLLEQQEETEKFDAENLLEMCNEWLRANYERYFTHDVDRKIVEGIIYTIDSRDDRILNGRKGNTEFILDNSELEFDDYNTHRYYKVKTIIGKIYRELRQKHDNGEKVTKDTKITVTNYGY